MNQWNIYIKINQRWEFGKGHWRKTMSKRWGKSNGRKLCNNVWYELLLFFTCLYKNNSLSHTMILNYGVGFLWDPWFTKMLWWKLTIEPNHVNSNTTTGQFSISCPCLGCQMSEEYLCLDQYPDCSFHFTWQRPFSLNFFSSIRNNRLSFY